MRPSELLIFLLAAKAIQIVSAVQDPENYRLPRFYDQLDYKVDLDLGPELFTPNGTQFSGKVEIRFTLKNITDYVTLHSEYDMIKLNKITFENIEIPSSNYSVSNVTHILKIYVGNRVSTFIKYLLAIEYTGTMNEEGLFGVYKSSYVDRNNETKYIFTTQLGPSFARRLFPCFDEPAFKAYFNFSVTFPTGLNVFFNTKEMERIPNHAKNVTTVHFHQTPKMSAGSLALIVSEFTCTPANVDILPLRVCSRDEYESQRYLALDITPKLLASLNSFMNYKYGHLIGKLDIVGIPDLPASAVANWGLQIHMETELLYDKFESSNKYKEDVILVISHELSHEWFGNLITFKWYSELFIDEGLARYFEYYIANEVLPKSEFNKRFVVDSLHAVLIADGYGNVPLRMKNVTTRSEIESAYNPISYEKGGNIIRMVQHFMSLENFRNGIRNYINKYKYSNADSEGLWIELNKAVNKSVSKMPANLTTVMRGWVRQPGYPLVTVSLDRDIIKISQSRFLYGGVDKKSKWFIPISYTTSCHSSKFQSTTPDVWLTPDSVKQATFPSNCKWIILNNQQIGYYRVNYDTTLWARIKSALQEEEFDGIIDINRAQIVDDLFNLAMADKLPYSSALDSIRFLKNDTSYYPWKAAMEGFEFLWRRVGEHSDLGKAIAADVLDLIENFYNSVPLSIMKEDDDFYTLKQLFAVDWACRLGHKNCIKTVLSMFQEYRKSKERPSLNLRFIVYCNGLRYSEDASDWYFMWEAYLNATDMPAELKVVRQALGCSTNKTLLRNYLQKSITTGSGFRPQDTFRVFTSVGGNPDGVDVAFDFLLENQEYIIENYQSIGVLEFLIVGMADRIRSEEQIQKLTDTIKNGELKEGFKEHGDKAISTAEMTRTWLRTYSKDLATYYKIQTDTNNYWYFLLLLFLPLFAVIVYIYYWTRRREHLLMFIRNLNPMNMQFRRREPANDIPMQER